VSTRALAAVHDLEQFRDVIESQADALGAADKAEAVRERGVIDPIPAVAANRNREQSKALVVADGVGEIPASRARPDTVRPFMPPHGKPSSRLKGQGSTVRSTSRADAAVSREPPSVKAGRSPVLARRLEQSKRHNARSECQRWNTESSTYRHFACAVVTGTGNLCGWCRGLPSRNKNRRCRRQGSRCCTSTA
jgi:hypothetical protein